MSSHSALLYHVAAKRHQSYRSLRLYPAAAGILNLFLCATFEQLLDADATGLFLAVFLFVEVSLYMTVSTFSFNTSLTDILDRTRIFPLSSRERLHFVLRSSLTKPLQIALVATTSFALIIQYHNSFGGAISATTLFLLLVLNAEVYLSSLLMVLCRKSISPGVVFVVIPSVFLFVIIGALLFKEEALVFSLPHMRWTVEGILAAVHGDFGIALGNAVWLTLSLILGYVIGRKLS
jgi:hypothetical protein